MAKKNKKHAIMSTNEWLRNLKRDIHFAVFGEEPDMIEIENPDKQETAEQQKPVETVKLAEPVEKLETPTPVEPKKVEGDTCIVGIILGQKAPAPVEKPAEEKPETIDVKPVEKLETAKPAEPEKQNPVKTQETSAETANKEAEQKPETPVVPPMIIKEGYQKKLSKSERKALRKQKKREEAEKKASSSETIAATATDKVKEAVAEGIENGEIDVVHTNPYIELIQSKVKSWDNQGNALDENGNVVVDANGNVVKVDPKAGMILMAMPQQQSQQQTA